MPRRPSARLITGDFDLRDGSFRTEYHSVSKSRLPVLPKGALGKKRPGRPLKRSSVLCSQRIWKKSGGQHQLRPEAEKLLGHAVVILAVKVKQKTRWKWNADSIQSLGVCNSIEAARTASLEEILRYLGVPLKHTAFEKLTRLAGYGGQPRRNR